MHTWKKQIWILLMMAVLLILWGCGDQNTPELREILQNTEEPEAKKGISDNSEVEEGASGNTEADGTLDNPEKSICVFVCGEVASPGVYYFSEGARKVDAVEAAGGFTEEANEDYVNLAELLTDEMQLYIPAMGESTADGMEGSATEAQAAHAGQINLNTASLEELCTLSGIGESKAQAILSYRKEHNGFGSIEELTQVSGIGESTFEKIKDKIYVE